MPQVFRKLVNGVPCPVGIVHTGGADGPERIVKKMRLDLPQHDLHPLLSLQVILMLPHELQMKPDVIEHTAGDDGDGQKCDRLSGPLYNAVKVHRDENHRNDEDRDQLFPLPSGPVITNGLD